MHVFSSCLTTSCAGSFRAVMSVTRSVTEWGLTEMLSQRQGLVQMRAI